MDDQAETVLLNMIRGAGLDGLAAMRPGPVHPMLAVRRSETQGPVSRASGSSRSTTPPTNDRRFVRNRIRHELLPLCSDIAGRDVVPLLARQASVLAAEASFLDEQAAALDATDAAALAAAPVALARRATRQLQLGVGPYRRRSGRGRAGAGRGPGSRAGDRRGARAAGPALLGPSVGQPRSTPTPSGRVGR